MPERLQKRMWSAALWQVGTVTATWAAMPLGAWLVLPSGVLPRLFRIHSLGWWFNLAIGGAMAVVLLAMLSGFVIARTRFYYLAGRCRLAGQPHWRHDLWWSLEWLAAAGVIGLVVFGMSFGWILAAGVAWGICGIVARWIALHDARQRLQRPSRTVIGIAVALLLLPLLSYGILIGLTRIEQRRIAALRAELTQAGYVTSVADVAKWYGPVEHDGAPVLYELIAWQKANQDGSWRGADDLLEHFRSPLPSVGDPVYREVRDFFAANPEYIRLADELTDFEQIRFRRDWSDKYNVIPLAELNPMRGIAQWDRIRMLAAWESGDTAEALRLWQKMGRLRRQLLEDPLLISTLVGKSIEMIRLSALNQGMNRFGALSEEQLRAIPENLSGVEAEIALACRKAIQGESAFLWDCASLAEAEKVGWFWWAGDPKMLPQFGSLSIVKSWVLAKEQYALAGILKPTLQAVTLELPLALRNLEEIQHRVERMSLLELDGVNMIGVASFGQLPQFRIAALLRSTTLLAAAELYYRRHGEFPERAEQLVPDCLSAIPQDPYTDAPMCYRRISPTEAVVYSVGPNRSDDGGKVDAAKPQSGMDIGFTLKH